MRDDAVRAYKRPPHISAEDELEALGYVFAENTLFFCERIVSGKLDHWGLPLFYDQHRDVPVYRHTDGSRCALVAVEDDGAGDRLVSIMLACPAGKPVAIAGSRWDGFDMTALCFEFLLPRLQHYFP